MSTLFTQSDPRTLIRRWVAARPQKGRGEMTRIAELLRIPAPVWSQILSGQRQLSEDQGFILSEYMGLTELEREYLICLIQIDRADQHQYKKFLKEKLQHIREKSGSLVSRLNHEKVLDEKDQAEFYSSWLYSAVRLSCGLKNGQNLESIMQLFKLERERAARIIQFLLDSNLIKSESGRLTLGASRTHIARTSPFVSKHHANWRIKAMDRAQNLKESELMFTGPMSISESDFEYLKEKMIALIQELAEKVKDSESETLACFNLDFFKL